MAISVSNGKVDLIVMRPRDYVRGLQDLVNEHLTGKSNLVGVEIGSFQGESAEIFLQSNAFQKLYCIDAWANGYDSTDAASYQADLAEVAFDRRFAHDERIVKVKGYSFDVASMIPDNLDFLYIDGCHKPEAVRQDLEMYACKVKQGGIIAGHDYEPTHYAGLMAVVDSYFGHKPEHTYIDKSWVNIKH